MTEAHGTLNDCVANDAARRTGAAGGQAGFLNVRRIAAPAAIASSRRSICRARHRLFPDGSVWKAAMASRAQVGPITRYGALCVPKCDSSQPVSHKSGIPDVWSEW